LTVNYEELKKYKFVQDFSKGKKPENEFIRDLIQFSNGPEFKKSTGIKSLNGATIKEIVSKLADKRIGRRSFIKAMGIGFLGLPGFKANDNKESDLKKLLNKIRAIPKLSKARIAYESKPSDPVIIIMEDKHGGENEKFGWKVEFEKLELLRANFGINFVGVEGWAGPSADASRGRLILNGEEPLILNLMKNSNYHVIGLENPILQIEALELMLYATYEEFTISYRAAESVIRKSTKKSDEFQKLPESVITLSYSMLREGRHTMDGILASVREMAGKICGQNNEELLGFLKNSAKRFVEIVFQMAKLYEMREFDLEAIRQKIESIETKFPFLKGNPLFFLDNPNTRKIVYDERDMAAVKIMLSAISMYKRNVGVVVYGSQHSMGLNLMFQRQTKYNISIIILEEDSPTKSQTFKNIQKTAR